MKILKNLYYKIIHFLQYRIHLSEFKLMWMCDDVNKKWFKKHLFEEILLMYDKIDHEIKKYKRIMSEIG